MRMRIELESVLAGAALPRAQQLELFAYISLGVVDSLARGVLTVENATRYFFHAANGLFVRERLRSKVADRIMSHGVQLADLREALPRDLASQRIHAR